MILINPDLLFGIGVTFFIIAICIVTFWNVPRYIRDAIKGDGK